MKRQEPTETFMTKKTSVPWFIRSYFGVVRVDLGKKISYTEVLATPVCCNIYRRTAAVAFLKNKVVTPVCFGLPYVFCMTVSKAGG